MTELVYQSLATLRLLHDALLVVLSDAAAELVIIHRGPILSFTPKSRDAHRVFDLEDPFVAIQPAYAGAVNARALQQLLQELPEMNMATAVAHLTACTAVVIVPAALSGSAILILVCTQRIKGTQGVRNKKRN